MKESEIIHITNQLRQKAIAVCKQYSLGTEEAEDIAQEAMYKLWKVKDDIHDEIHAKNLTIRISKQLCIDNLRQKKHLSVDIDKESYRIEDSKNSRPDVALEISENEIWLEKKIKGLSSTLKQVFLLRTTERKNNEEIADLLNMTPTSVATTLSKARHQILEEIKKKRKDENRT